MTPTDQPPRDGREPPAPSDGRTGVGATGGASGTTLHSLRDEAAALARGARVHVIVPGAERATTLSGETPPAARPSDRGSRPGLGVDLPAPSTRRSGEPDPEGRAWIVVGIAIVLVSIAVGFWLGLR